FAVAHFFRGQALSQLDRHDEAIGALEHAAQLSGSALEMRAALACAYARAGRLEPARRIQHELDARSRAGFVSPVLLAQVHTSLGENGSAIEALARAIRWRAADLAWLRVRPVFDPLRGEPRFEELLEEIHLSSRTLSAAHTGPDDDLAPTRIL